MNWSTFDVSESVEIGYSLVKIEWINRWIPEYWCNIYKEKTTNCRGEKTFIFIGDIKVNVCRIRYSLDEQRFCLDSCQNCISMYTNHDMWFNMLVPYLWSPVVRMGVLYLLYCIIWHDVWWIVVLIWLCVFVLANCSCYY